MTPRTGSEISQPTYAAASAAARRIHQKLARYTTTSGSPTAMLPEPPVLAALIDAAFWTSLRREEVYVPRISFAFVAPEQLNHPISLAAPLSFEPRDLTKLSGAAERPGVHLCVWPKHDEEGKLQVWGIAHKLPPLCVVLEIILPGLVVIKQNPLLESGKFLNIAVLQGDEIKIIHSQEADGPNPPEVLSALLRMESQFAIGSTINALLQIAVSMRAHGRGGLLLVVPSNSSEWKTSVLHPLTYEVTPPFSRLADLMRKHEINGRLPQNWEDEAARTVDKIAGLTAVDGATVITADYHLLAFGAKIVRRSQSPQVSTVIVTEPVEGSVPIVAEPVELGGTRHLAAAQFVHDQRDTIALVASQDGRFTVFGWSPQEAVVHARRIDALLL